MGKMLNGEGDQTEFQRMVGISKRRAKRKEFQERKQQGQSQGDEKQRVCQRDGK